jgi:hypothetical protein
VADAEAVELGPQILELPHAAEGTLGGEGEPRRRLRSVPPKRTNSICLSSSRGAAPPPRSLLRSEESQRDRILPSVGTTGSRRLSRRYSGSTPERFDREGAGALQSTGYAG